MKTRAILMLFVSLALAALVAISANSWLSKQGEQMVSETEQCKVVTAAMEIPLGTKIDANMLEVIDFPKTLLPEGSCQSADDVVGRVATSKLYKGEILHSGRINDPAGGSILASLVQEGMRAITVRVDEVVGVAGFLTPGSRVDVIATQGRANEVRSETLISDLKVLAVGQSTSEVNGPEVVRAVTLEANPTQAEEIVRATQTGKLQLTLRNPLEMTEPVVMTSRDQPESGEIGEDTAPSAAEPVRAKTRIVVLIRGMDDERLTFMAKPDAVPDLVGQSAETAQSAPSIQ